MRFVWVAHANNAKTGPIPTAYVGATRAETWFSCEGCELRPDRAKFMRYDATECYAWNSMLVPALGKVQTKALTVDQALAGRRRVARVARLGALGDPSRVDRTEYRASVAKIRAAGLGVVGYTHFWREPENAELSSDCMASCDSADQAPEAAALGFRPAVVVRGVEGATFDLPSVGVGLVCPAQRKDAVTCNTCGLCDPTHPVWSKGKIQAIGFLDHSPGRKRGKVLT